MKATLACGKNPLPALPQADDAFGRAQRKETIVCP